MRVFGKGAALVVAASLPLATAFPLPSEIWGTLLAKANLFKRSLFGPTQSTGFPPNRINCPSSGLSIRDSSSGLSSAESDYVNARLNANPWTAYFEQMGKNASDFNLDLAVSIPTIGMAFSGGGYRAMLNGAGGYSGTLSSESSAVQARLAGLMNLTSYMTGLSGGSWFVTTLFANNGQTPRELSTNGIWDLTSNLILPDYGFFDTGTFYTKLVSTVDDKGDEGFPTAITDYWSLALGQHLLPPAYRVYAQSDGVNNNANLTFSALANGPAYTARELPYPIVVAAEREPGEIIVPANATLYEFSTTEFGTFAFGGGGSGGGFAPIKYLGTDYSGGSPSSDHCYVGFDNAAFVAGTSSTLFNGAYLSLNSSSVSGVASSIIKNAIEAVLKAIGEDQNDVALYPNPFKGWHPDTNPLASIDDITLVDAGLTNQNIPLEPLLLPARHIDTIIAFDASGDTDYSYPNGSAMVTTYDRLLSLTDRYDISVLMPPVPSTAAFVHQGLNSRPTFFGCTNLTNSDFDNAPNVTGSEPPPMIIYVPNYVWSFASNTSTYKLEYSEEDTIAMIDNGIRTLTLNNTVFNWSECLMCAMADRTVYAQGKERTSMCQECLDTWCWAGDQSEGSVEAGGKSYAPTVGSLPSFIQELTSSS